MPTYKITAPDGRTLKITGDTPPTEQELNEIFSYVSDNSGNNAEISNTKGIDLTPSGLVKQGLSTVLAPVRGALYGEDFQTARQNALNNAKQFKPAGGVGDFLVDMYGYSQLPVLKGGGVARALGNAAIQGGVVGGIEALKNDNNVLGGAGIGTGTALGINAALGGVPIIGAGLQKLINNPNFQGGLAKTLEGLTSVPADYSQRAIEAELAGNSIFKGKFDKNTAYRPIEQKLRQAKSMLPNAESYADQFYNLGQKAKTNIENLKEAAGQEINDMLGNLNAEPISIGGLKNSLNSLIKSYAKGGDINPAEVRAGRDIEQVKDLLKIKNDEQITKDLSDYFVNNRLTKEYTGKLSQADKEAQDVAFNILARATGKDKRWLQSQLNANLPNMSTQKRQEFIQNLLENTNDKIEVSGIDPTWYNYFPELSQVGEQYGISGKELAEKAFNKIMRKDFSTPESLIDAQYQGLDVLDSQYDKILYNLTKNPSQKGIDNAFVELDKMTENLSDDIKNVYMQKFANDFENIQNITGGSKVKPIDLHNVKETLYDIANYNTEGGIRQNTIKGIANQINNFLRTKYPQYKVPNDKFAAIKKLEYNLGGSNGLNANTLGGKLANYGTQGNLISGLDRRLRDINNILPLNQQFINDTKKLVNSQNEVNNILNTVNKQYERNPRLLANRTDEVFETALEDLQNKTGVQFMDELNNIRAREALEQATPGQGGGYGSAQGFWNRVRGDILTSFGGRGIPGISTAAAATLFSPKIIAQGSIKNLGRLYRNLGKDVPDAVKKLINPLAVMGTTPMLYGGISND